MICEPAFHSLAAMPLRGMPKMEIKKGRNSGVGVPDTYKPGPPKPGELIQTPWEIEGPYFRLGTPERANLLEPGDKPECVLSGRVLNERGVPIPRAIVHLWSSDREGNYDTIGYRYNGYQICDDQGRYEFTTIVPARYDPRDARHFHVRVQGNSRPITTQLFFEDDPGKEEDELYHSLLEIKHSHTDADGVWHGTFDFVLKQVSDHHNVRPDCLAARV
jgi:protocatechuate 3,4-dioxygenase beta subunit